MVQIRHVSRRLYITALKTWTHIETHRIGYEQTFQADSNCLWGHKKTVEAKDLADWQSLALSAITAQTCLAMANASSIALKAQFTLIQLVERCANSVGSDFDSHLPSAKAAYRTGLEQLQRLHRKVKTLSEVMNERSDMPGNIGQLTIGEILDMATGDEPVLDDNSASQDRSDRFDDDVADQWTTVTYRKPQISKPSSNTTEKRRFGDSVIHGWILPDAYPHSRTARRIGSSLNRLDYRAWKARTGYESGDDNENKGQEREEENRHNS